MRGRFSTGHLAGPPRRPPRRVEPVINAWLAFPRLSTNSNASERPPPCTNGLGIPSVVWRSGPGEAITPQLSSSTWLLGQRNRSCSRQLTICGTWMSARCTWPLRPGRSTPHVDEFLDLVDVALEHRVDRPLVLRQQGTDLQRESFLNLAPLDVIAHPGVVLHPRAIGLARRRAAAGSRRFGTDR